MSKCIVSLVLIGTLTGIGQIAEAQRAKVDRSSFFNAKTLFQTNTPYDPRSAIAVDGVIVHRHGVPPGDLTKAIASWGEHDFRVGRMFFADSDATNEYWTGKWDGQPHEDEVERNEKGEVVKCSGIRPYMLPTEGWIRYLEEMAAESIDAGAEAVLPEEPLAHVHTGYEDAFKRLWVERYGRPWEPESASAEARFLTAQLKNELYIKLEQRLARVVKQRSNGKVPLILPIHSLYSNVASSLVAPLGTSADIADVDGYIGQIWTGPVNWALHHYDSSDKTFFASAYLLYDYFVAMTTGSGKKLWLLVDPVEDDPNHKWSEFEQWYRHCVVALLLFPTVDSYEVMPWPDRIFLPGYDMGGGKTPAPERFRLIVLSATQVLQEVPLGGQWNPHLAGQPDADPTGGVGVAVADTVLWEKEAFPTLQVTYGLMMPLVQAGVPVSACVMDRAGEPDYLSRFKVIVLSYEAFKPLDPNGHEALAAWVRAGGSLVVLGQAETVDGKSFWWNNAGYASPLHHLFAELGMDGVDRDGDHSAGKGFVQRRTVSPRAFGQPAGAEKVYLPLIKSALSKIGDGNELNTPGYFCLKRGPFVIAHATRSPLKLAGTFVDVFEPDLPVIENVAIKPGSGGVYRDVSELLAGKQPCVLHTTHRLISERSSRVGNRLVIRGPAETPAVVRMLSAGREIRSVSARNASREQTDVTSKVDGSTVLLKFPNDPAGVTLEIKWK